MHNKSFVKGIRLTVMVSERERGFTEALALPLGKSMSDIVRRWLKPYLTEATR